MRKVLKIGVPVLLVLLAAGGVAFWYFVLRDTAPPEASLDNLDTPTTTAGATTSLPATPDGTWVVQPAEDVFVGYRAQEQFAGDTIQKTAAGRSPAVAGTIVVAANQVTSAEFQVDMTKLASDQARRDNLLRTDGLQTDAFPMAYFKLSAPIPLGAVQIGTPIRMEAVGDLNLHGVTKPVTVQIEARWDGGSIAVVGSTPIAMADFGISPPQVAGFVSVDGNGVMEFQLRFVPAL
jgi:polyisoprenoid-binding protein YceI